MQLFGLLPGMQLGARCVVFNCFGISNHELERAWLCSLKVRQRLEVAEFAVDLATRFGTVKPSRHDNVGLVTNITRHSLGQLFDKDYCRAKPSGVVRQELHLLGFEMQV